MDLPQLFRHKSRTGIHHTYGLTALGKTKAEEYIVSGPKGEVLSSINENGPSSVSEISNETKVSTDKVKRIMNELIRSGYVRRVSSDES